jgi:predicted nucleic acid-binding protein
VIGETYTLLRMRLGHAAAHEFLRHSRASARTKRVFIPEAWEDEAESVLAKFADHDFSFVDATSFVVMRKLGLRAAFAFDHHFLVAGYLLVADS